ncbi:hypothetical protein LINPERPRIM_LOCUS21559 [Linum perenne]
MDVVRRLNDIDGDPKSIVKLKPLIVEEFSLFSYQQLKDTDVIRICGMNGVESVKSAKLIYDNTPGSTGLASSFRLKNPQFLPKPTYDPVEPEMRWIKKMWDDDGEFINAVRSCDMTKVLVIVDNVHKLENLLQVAAGFGWFGSGSRIVVSTVDVSRKVLKVIHGQWDAPSGGYNNYNKNKNKYLDVACFMNEMMDDRDLMRRLKDSLASGGLVDESVWRIRIDKYDGVGMVDNGKLEINTELPLFKKMTNQVLLKALFGKNGVQVLKGFFMAFVVSMIAYRAMSSMRRITSLINECALMYFTKVHKAWKPYRIISSVMQKESGSQG